MVEEALVEVWVEVWAEESEGLAKAKVIS